MQSPTTGNTPALALAPIRRTTALVAAALAVLCLPGSARSEEPRALATGDAVPELAFVDIEGQQTSLQSQRDSVLVISFGDRGSSEAMKEWMAEAQLRVMKAHPELPTAYLAFADVSGVPRLMRGMVRPFLRRSHDSANEDLATSQRAAGIEPDPTRWTFRFAADWDGAYLAAFGLEDATDYHCWIAAEGRVVAALDPSTPEIAERYFQAFETIARQRRQTNPL